jgi:lauroyl/myristoyl acyltransferase
MKLLTYDDLGNILLLLLSASATPRWFRSRALRRGIGRLDDLLRSGRSRSVRTALADALGRDATEESIRELARLAVEYRWESNELFWFRRIKAEEERTAMVRENLDTSGMEHLYRALEADKGAIIWDSPFGNRLVARLALLDQGLPLTVVHGPHHGGGTSKFGRRWILPRYQASERRAYPDIVPIQENSPSHVLEIRKRLAGNGVVSISSIGDMGKTFGVFAFLGVRQCFGAGVPALAHLTGAKLIPAFCYRQPGGRYRFVLEPPFDPKPDEDLEQSTMRALAYYVKRVEQHALRYPQQWARWYDRLVPERLAGATLMDSTSTDHTGQIK